jgi:hypothetical protein
MEEHQGNSVSHEEKVAIAEEFEVIRDNLSTIMSRWDNGGRIALLMWTKEACEAWLAEHLLDACRESGDSSASEALRMFRFIADERYLEPPSVDGSDNEPADTNSDGPAPRANRPPVLDGPRSRR